MSPSVEYEEKSKKEKRICGIYVTQRMLQLKMQTLEFTIIKIKVFDQIYIWNTNLVGGKGFKLYKNCNSFKV